MSAYRDLTAALPLKPFCNAALIGRTVFLYYGTEDARGACCAMIDVAEREEPTVELLHGRCPPAAWKLVSDWEPAEEAGNQQAASGI